MGLGTACACMTNTVYLSAIHQRWALCQEYKSTENLVLEFSSREGYWSLLLIGLFKKAILGPMQRFYFFYLKRTYKMTW